MNVHLNDHKYEIQEGSTVLELLKVIGYKDHTGIAIAVNEEVLKNDQWGSVHLNPDDRLTMIKPIQGG